jgi:multiple sugar transport system ATP-binding protein
LATLTLKNLTKTYSNGVCAVKDFNLDIEDKEFVILVGPSGCGKSTTLRMIAGLEDISKGELWIEDHLVNNVEPKDRDLSMVFQNYALYPHMTVYDNIAFSLKIRKTPKDQIKRQVGKVAKLLEIDYLLDRKPKLLSGGQRQRVAIGSAIIRQPTALLMDEPLSNLDAKLRAQMRVELSKLHKELQSTIIYVTHDQTEAMTLGTKIVVMKDSMIQQVATPYEIYNNPINKFVAGFIGSPAMNFIEANVVQNNNQVYLEFDNQILKLPETQKNVLVTKDYIGKRIIIGIRPEDMYYENTLTHIEADKTQIDVHVDLIERLGAEVLVYFNLSESCFSAKLRPDVTIKKDESIKLVLDTSKIKLFDLNTEINIMY